MAGARHVATRPAGLVPGLVTACPNCATRRIGQFRYCRSCGLDFDVTERSLGLRGPWRFDVVVSRQAPLSSAPSAVSGPADPGSVWARLALGRGRFPLRTVLAGAAVIGLVASLAAALVAR